MFSREYGRLAGAGGVKDVVSQLARALAFPRDEVTCPLNRTSKRAWIKEWLRHAGPDYRQIRANLWRAARQQSGF